MFVAFIDRFTNESRPQPMHLIPQSTTDSVRWHRGSFSDRCCTVLRTLQATCFIFGLLGGSTWKPQTTTDYRLLRTYHRLGFMDLRSTFITGPPTHSVGGLYCFLSGVCGRLSLSVTTLDGGPAGGFTRASQAMTSCRLQSNYSSTVTRHGGPVGLRPVRATPCYWYSNNFIPKIMMCIGLCRRLCSWTLTNTIMSPLPWRFYLVPGSTGVSIALFIAHFSWIRDFSRL